MTQDILAPSDCDIQALLSTEAHLGGVNCTKIMKPYVFGRADAGNHVINVDLTWKKLMLAARIIAAVRNPADVCVIGGSEFAQRAVLKFARYTGATPIAGRWTPGLLTNTIQKRFTEPRVLVVADPSFDHQAIREASYVNLPVISFCNVDNFTRFVDCVIPCNNRSKLAIGQMFWLLAREVLRMRGEISRTDEWVMVDLFIYRDPDKALEAEDESDEEDEEGDWSATAAIDEDAWGAPEGVPEAPIEADVVGESW